MCPWLYQITPILPYCIQYIKHKFVIYDQTNYSRHKKQTLKKKHPRTLFMESNFEKQMCFWKLHFPQEFFFPNFPWFSIFPCAKGTFFPDFQDRMNPVNGAIIQKPVTWLSKQINGPLSLKMFKKSILLLNKLPKVYFSDVNFILANFSLIQGRKR